MMKKTALLVCLFLALGFSILCDEMRTMEATDEESAIKEEITKRLKKKHVIKEIWYLDYDRNGRNEAFVLSGEKLSPKRKDWMPDDTDNNLWFSYVEEGQVKVKKIRKHVKCTAHLLKLKSVSFVCAGDYCVTSSPEDVYRVSGNEVHKIFHGDMIQGNEGSDDLTSVCSTYDFVKQIPEGFVSGHTWKPYYYYYTDGKIHEYQGKKIAEKALKKYQNGKAMLKKYKKLGKVTKIIYRTNNLIHVNYTSKSKYSEMYHYVTFAINDNTLKKLEVGEGKYDVTGSAKCI